jgi:glycosyltransferase involved in cell wall biosynthesis
MEVTLVNPIAATPDVTAAAILRHGGPTVTLPPSAIREINIVELGAAVTNLGHRVTVVLGSAYVGERDVAVSKNLSVASVHTLMTVPFHPGLLPMTPGLLRHPAVQEADVVQCSEFHQLSTFYASEAAFEHGIPVVVWQETFRPMRFPASLYQQAYEMALGPKVRAAAAKNVPRTTKAQAYLRRLGVRDGSISGWIPTGIDVQEFVPRPPSISPSEFGWEENSDILVLVARLSPSKGVDRALHLLKRLLISRPTVRLLVRGSGPQEAELRRLATDLGVSEFVRFLPRLSRTQMVDLYNLATVVISTSRSDLLPFALLEACACGRPIVAADVGAVADIVEDGRTGSLVPARDEDGFCRAVEAMLNDEERRLQCGRAGRVRAEAYFDMRLTAKRLVEVYHAAAG